MAIMGDSTFLVLGFIIGILLFIAGVFAAQDYGLKLLEEHRASNKPRKNLFTARPADFIVIAIILVVAIILDLFLFVADDPHQLFAFAPKAGSLTFWCLLAIAYFLGVSVILRFLIIGRRVKWISAVSINLLSAAAWIILKSLITGGSDTTITLFSLLCVSVGYQILRYQSPENEGNATKQ